MFQVRWVRLIGIILRLSLVIAAGITVYYSWQAHDSYLAAISQKRLADSSMECGLAISPAKIAELELPSGNFDIARLGCLPGADGKTFWTNRDELERFRQSRSAWELTEAPYKIGGDYIETFGWSFFIAFVAGIVSLAFFQFASWLFTFVVYGNLPKKRS